MTRDSIAVRPLSATETRRQSHVFRVTEDHMSGPLAQAVWLQSLNKIIHIFPGSRALLTQIFRSISRKKIGKKFPPGGSDPQIFYKSTYSSPRAMCLCNFIAIGQKLWPVAASELPCAQTNKEN